MILSHLCSLNAILFSSHDSLFVFICKNTHCSLVIFKLYPHSLFSILQPLLFINNKCASMEIFWLHGYRHFLGREGVSTTQLHYLMYFTQPAVNCFQYSLILLVILQHSVSIHISLHFETSHPSYFTNSMPPRKKRGGAPTEGARPPPPGAAGPTKGADAPPAPLRTEGADAPPAP